MIEKENNELNFLINENERLTNKVEELENIISQMTSICDELEAEDRNCNRLVKNAVDYIKKPKENTHPTWEEFELVLQKVIYLEKRVNFLERIATSNDNERLTTND